MTGTKKSITVNKKIYTVWADFIKRCMFAMDEDGYVKRINGNGYLKNELTIRKAIAEAYALPTFRK